MTKTEKGIMGIICFCINFLMIALDMVGVGIIFLVAGWFYVGLSLAHCDNCAKCEEDSDDQEN